MPEQQRRSLADKINQLFTTMQRSDGRPYTNDEVAETIRKRGGQISGTYIWMLRRGDRTNPTLQHIQALASFFRVDGDYFFDDDHAERIYDRIEGLSWLRGL